MKVSSSIRSLHIALDDVAGKLQYDVNNILKPYCENNKWLLKSRIKGSVSFAQKIETGAYTDLTLVDDFLGFEITVPSLKEIPIVKEFIRKNFKVISEKPTDAKPASEFSFDGVRMYLQLDESVKPKPYAWMRFEVQVKTLLEKAWGEATHDFTYKCKDIKWEKERLVFQMKALLAHADIVLADAEELSKNKLLKKKYQEYEDLNKISRWVIRNWNDSEYPENMKRLSETISKLCKHYNIEFDDLKKVVRNHRRKKGKPRDLSVYSSILQALFDEKHSGFIEKISNKPKKNHHLKIIIPDEVVIDPVIKSKLHGQRCWFATDMLKGVE